MIPIQDIDGNIIGYGGRHLESMPQKAEQQTKQAKYINSRDTLLFKKSAGLYALNFAKPYIEHCDEVVIVEGYLDVMTLHDNGLQNIVGSLGTALNTYQVSISAYEIIAWSYMIIYSRSSLIVSLSSFSWNLHQSTLRVK